MPVKVDLSLSKEFASHHSVADTFRRLADVEKSIPSNYPGMIGFEKTGPSTYRWVFEKVSVGGYDYQLKMVTRFSTEADNRLTMTAVPEAGCAVLNGSWKVEPQGKGARVIYSVQMEEELPVPGFLKAMAVPLAQREMTKVFDQYIANVAHSLS